MQISNRNALGFIAKMLSTDRSQVIQNYLSPSHTRLLFCLPLRTLMSVTIYFILFNLLFFLSIPRPAYASVSDLITERLVSAGWERQAANAVATLNHTFFDIQREESPTIFDQKIDALCKLGKHPVLFALFRKHPETAGLFVGDTDHEARFKTFNDESCYITISSSYQQFCAPEDADKLTSALLDHGSLICKIGKRGVLGAAIPFIFPNKTDAGQEYGRWLASSFGSALASMDDERFDVFFSFISNKGQEIRQRMEREPLFLSQFRTTLWPALLRVVERHSYPGNDFETLTSDDRLWDLLLRKDGEKLLDSWGLEAIDLLTGNNALPRDFQDFAAKLMLTGSPSSTISAMKKYCHEPLFRQFMGRNDLSDSLRTKALARLDKADLCPQPIKCLETFIRLSPSALQSELGPDPTEGFMGWLPMYSSFYEFKKAAQGRDVDAVALGFAVFEVYSISTLGTGTAIVSSLKGVGKQAGTTIARKSMAQEGKEYIAKKLGQGAADRARSQLIEAAAIKASQSTIRKEIQAMAAKWSNVMAMDITGPVRWVFSKSGIGRESFKRLTKMDARIFMRSDRRILIHPEKGPAAWFLKDTAAKAVLQKGKDYVTSTSVDKQTMLAVKKTAEDATKHWQENASAWWLINNAQELPGI
jgi:hypothetical protein